MTDPAVKRCTYDWDGQPDEGPRPGDCLVTKTGRRWQVLESRQVKSRVHPSRWALKILRVPAGLFKATRELDLVWAPRGRKTERTA